MFSIWHHGLICISLLWNRREVAADGEDFERNITLTWDEARKYCEDIGKVLLDVTKNGSDMFLNKTLKDTNQTWVSARIEFSHFYKVPVCMETPKQSITRKLLDTDIVGNCFKLCNEYWYAGVKERECFCFNDASTHRRSNGCNATCIYNPIFQCGGNESISLYERADKTITHHIKNGSKECVYATVDRGAFNLQAESCVAYLANGAVCENAIDTACREHSWTVVNNTICQMDLKMPLTWKQAKELCGGIGGHLMSSALSIRNIESNSTYWHGLFRYPTLRKVNEPQGITSDSDCAIVRKKGDYVTVEGENCLEKGTFICQDETPMRSSSSPRSTTSPGKGNSLEPCDATCVIGLIAALSAMMLVVSLITCLVCLYRRRHLSQEYENVGVNQSSRLHVQGSPQLTEERNYLTAISGGLNPITNDNYDSIMSEQSVHGAGSSNITEDQNYLTVLSSDLNPVPSETYEQLRLEQFLDNEYFEHKYECIKKDKMYANTD